MRALTLRLHSCLLATSVCLATMTPGAWAADPPPGAASVRVYRCTDSRGTVSLQDAPCGQGRQQQVLDMQRPQDPPPVAAASSGRDGRDAATSRAVRREIRIVHVGPAQPMYECITAEGERYTSDTPDGNPRWVPTWTYGYAGARGRPVPPGGPYPPGPGPGSGHRPPYGQGPGPGVIVPFGSVQIRDECHALPQQEVCARLRDRRWELIRRYNSALQSEREQLTREQRGIDARLDQDCGGA